MYMIGHDNRILYFDVMEMLMKRGNAIPYHVSNLAEHCLLINNKSKAILAVMCYNRNKIVIRCLIIISIPPDIFTMWKIHVKNVYVLKHIS